MKSLNELQKVVKSVVFGDMRAIWIEEKGKVDFVILPEKMVKRVPKHRRDTNKTVACRVLHKIWEIDFPTTRVENAIQYHISGDPQAGVSANGSCMRESKSLDRIKSYSFVDIPNGVELHMLDDRKLESIQSVTWQPGDKFLRVSTRLVNKGKKALNVEYLTSFSLGGLSPLVSDDGAGKYDIYRWHSNWSAECRMEKVSAENAGLERSWAGFQRRSMRFGQCGTTPARDYFPMVALRDKSSGVIWGAALDVFGSWQLEVTRLLDQIYISGGLADKDFGHWIKTLAPGETFVAPEAALSCVRGDIEALQNRMVGYSEGEVRKNEEDLPIIFNEWCTTWGKPYPENLLPVAKKLDQYPVRYFVMDDGWFRKDGYGIGDWVIAADKYPDGFKNFVETLRGKGYIPGIWFEFENAVEDARIFKEKPEWFLHLNGDRIQTGIRSFLDFRRPEVIDYLAEKVISFLKENHIGYLKVDYNAPTGYGCDGAESPGEGLRQHVECVVGFFRRILAELPELVLEICASGGNRISPAWLRLGALVSSSDAHEGVEIPLVAGNTAAMLPMRKNQIWAVLHPEDDDNRFYYSLSAGFLGRLCLSGEISKLTKKQTKLVKEACQLFRKVVPLLQQGDNHNIRKIGASYLAPTGYQVFLRQNDDLAMAVVHTFGKAPAKISFTIPEKWHLDDSFMPPEVVCTRKGNKLILSKLTDFQGMVLFFSK